MGHPQPKTPIQTDNSTTEGFINSKIQPKCTKSMDMRFEWLKDREAKNQFRFFWRLGKTNLADYFMKHHPPDHHWNVRREFLTRVADLVRLCVSLLSKSNKRDGNFAQSAISNLLFFWHQKCCKGVLNARYVSTYLIRIYVSKLMAILAKAIQPVLGKCFGDLKPSFARFQFYKTRRWFTHNSVITELKLSSIVNV